MTDRMTCPQCRSVKIIVAYWRDPPSSLCACRDCCLVWNESNRPKNLDPYTRWKEHKEKA
jgi:hypothetical protein